jgi:hypothetical protein
MLAMATVLLAAVFASPPLAAAEEPEEGAVVESPAPSPWFWSHWTKERLEQAEPLPLVTLPGPEPTGEAEPTVTPKGEEKASTAAVTYGAAAHTAAVEGIEVATAESTVFPSSSSGKVFGSYYIPLGGHQYERQDYTCSAAVVDSPRGDLIVTAGHCVIDPETGTATSSELIFVPGYRNGSAPFGYWRIQSYAVPEAWKNTAKAGQRPNEGADLAFVSLWGNEEGESFEEATVGAFDVAFDQQCNQTYTQFGYPAEYPYGGELLYSHNAAYAGADTEGAFSPVPMKIASDFTRGASGGPWAVGIGTGAPTVVSVTAYGYANQPGYLFGPYFGEAAKKAYGAITKQSLPAQIEETCGPLPPIPTPSTPTTTPPPSTPPAAAPPPAAVPAEAPVNLRVARVRRLTNGSAVLTAKVSAAGVLKLTGAAVRAESLAAPTAGKYRLVVAPKGTTTRRLRQVGKAKVGVKVTFNAYGETKLVKRKIALSRPDAGQKGAPHPN